MPFTPFDDGFGNDDDQIGIDWSAIDRPQARTTDHLHLQLDMPAERGAYARALNATGLALERLAGDSRVLRALFEPIQTAIGWLLWRHDCRHAARH